MKRLVLLGTAPSVNHMYANTKFGKRVLKKGAKEWYNDVIWSARLWSRQNNWSTATEKVIVRLWFYFPDNRKRDTHNALKALLDALEDAQIYSNDRYALPQIVDWQVDRDNPRIEIEFEKVGMESETG